MHSAARGAAEAKCNNDITLAFEFFDQSFDRDPYRPRCPNRPRHTDTHNQSPRLVTGTRSS